MSEKEILIGGLYAASNDNGSIGIWKVLAVDGIRVSLRNYSNEFPTRPSQVDPAALTIAFIGDIRMSRKSFWEMESALVHVESVTDEELDGCRMPPCVEGALSDSIASNAIRFHWDNHDDLDKALRSLALQGAAPNNNPDPAESVQQGSVKKKWWQFWK